jgi:hypothetical protein
MNISGELITSNLDELLAHFIQNSLVNEIKMTLHATNMLNLLYY